MNETNNPNNVAGGTPADPANRSGGTRTIQPLAASAPSSEPTPSANFGTNYQNDEVDDSSGFIDKPISVNPRYEAQKKSSYDDNEGSKIISTVITVIVIIIGLFQFLAGIASLFLERYEPYGYFFIGLQILIGLGLIFRIETARKVIVFLNIVVIAIFIALLLLLIILPTTQLPSGVAVNKWAIATPGIVVVLYFIIETKIISLKSVKKVFR